MRTSHESRSLSLSLSFVSVLLLLLSNTIGALGAYKWRDCGDKLDRVFSYHSVTVYPDPVIGGGEVAVNVAAEISHELIFTGNELSVSYNGQQVYSLNTTDMCSLTRAVTCPFKQGRVSYTEVFSVPKIPGGSYTFQVRNIFGKENFQREIGCLEVTVDVATPALSGCSFSSYVEAHLVDVPAWYQTPAIASRRPGDQIQIGPVWGNSTLSWGSFSSIKASTDLLASGAVARPADFVWGLKGALISSAQLQGGSYSLRYIGDFFVGHVGSVFNHYDRLDNPLLMGTFDLILTYAPRTNGIPPVSGMSGSINLSTPLGVQPTGFPYILGFGRLNNLTVSTQGSSYIVSSQKEYVTCLPTPVNNPSNIQNGATPGTSNWTDEQKWALALGIVGGLLILMIPFLLWLAWRQRKNQRYLNDDDLVDPLKPDYGSLAINDIIEEGDDLPKQ
eukprot:TRINITY_DN356_c0_g1_i1.p1 TRINITY_DN356_c0_g1~~TRINITY_DN356_c0_g1_i1.p1  ORF type:complete len:446 (-),score=84.45 TRINITY_DN356_c0_g1_i1:60-1397(-)